MNKYIFRYFCMWLCFSGLLALLDIGCKYWIRSNLVNGEILYIFPVINFYYVQNSGLAFGLLSNIGVCCKWIFVCIVLSIIVVLGVILYQSIQDSFSYDKISYAMLIGGALGNLYDRIFYGTVLDFIDFHFKLWHWPVFNIADLEICIGTLIFFIKYCFSFKRMY